MSTGERFVLGLLAVTFAAGLFGAVTFMVMKAQTAFTSRGPHARIQARAEISKRERDAATPVTQMDAPRRP